MKRQLVVENNRLLHLCKSAAFCSGSCTSRPSSQSSNSEDAGFQGKSAIDSYSRAHPLLFPQSFVICTAPHENTYNKITNVRAGGERDKCSICLRRRLHVAGDSNDRNCCMLAPAESEERSREREDEVKQFPLENRADQCGPKCISQKHRKLPKVTIVDSESDFLARAFLNVFSII